MANCGTSSESLARFYSPLVFALLCCGMSFGITTNKQRGDSRSTVTRRWDEVQLRSDSAVLTINGLTSQSEPKVQKTIIRPHPVKMLEDRMLLSLLLLMKYWLFRELQNALSCSASALLAHAAGWSGIRESTGRMRQGE